MCLDSRKTKKEMDKWLRTQPDIITAYKVVRKIKINEDKCKYVPIYFRKETKRYKKKNRIRGNRPQLYPCDTPRRPYKAYFHLWLNPPSIEMLYYPECSVLIKCHVPKHLIEAVGLDNGIPTIVSKDFDIIEEIKSSDIIKEISNVFKEI